MKFATIVAIGAVVLTGIGAVAGLSKDGRWAYSETTVSGQKSVTEHVHGNSRTGY